MPKFIDKATRPDGGNVVDTNLVEASTSDSRSTARVTGKVLDGFFCQYTGQAIQAYETDEITSDDDVDNIIYFKSGNKYYKRFTNELTPEMFGAIGDGVTDDSAAIQKAIETSATLFKPVSFSQKTYYIGTSTIIGKSGVSLYGNRLAKILTSATYSDGAAFNFTDCSDWSIDGLVFNGNKTVNSDGQMSADYDTPDGRALAILNRTSNITTFPSNFSITNCQFYNFAYCAIRVMGENIEIDNNIVRYCGRYKDTTNETSWVDSALQVVHHPSNSNTDISTSPYYSENVKIRNNTVEYSGAFGISTESVRNSIVFGNTVRYCAYIGIGNTFGYNNLYTGNKISYTHDNGIDLQRCVGNLVDGNSFTFCGNGMLASGSSGSHCAVFVGDDLAAWGSIDNTISNNYIFGGYDGTIDSTATLEATWEGIEAPSNLRITIRGNIIKGIGCRISSSAQRLNDGTGIFSFNNKNEVIHDNIISYTKWMGIYEQNSELCYGHSIRNNTVYYHGQFGICVRNDGESDEFIVRGNTIKGYIPQYTYAIPIVGSITGGIAFRTNAKSDSSYYNNVDISDNNLFAYYDESYSTNLYTYGIYVISNGSTQISNFSLAGNRFYGIASGSCLIISNLSLYAGIYNTLRDNYYTYSGTGGRILSSSYKEAGFFTSYSPLGGDAALTINKNRSTDVYQDGWLYAGTTQKYLDITVKGFSDVTAATLPASALFGIRVFDTSKGRPAWYSTAYSLSRWVDSAGRTFAANYGTTSARPTTLNATYDKGFDYYDTTLAQSIRWNGTSWDVSAILLEGTWSITSGTVLTAATASYSKIGKQVALSGTLTFATAATDVTITLPYAPDYGGTFTFGNLTFTLTSGSTTATVQSSVITTAQTFQLNYKTA